MGALIDQAASSLQNFAILVAALHWFELDLVGAFSLLYAVMTLVVVIVRSLTLEPLVVQHSGAAHRAAGPAMGASLIVSLAASGLVLVAVPALTGYAWLLASAAIVLPVLLVQDAYRYVMFADGRQMAAALNDSLCLAGTSVVVAVLWISPWRHPALLVLAWGLGALAGVVAGARQTHSVPRPADGRAWLREQRRLGLPLAASQLAQQGSGRLSQALITGIGGAAALGMVSASRTVITPMTTLVTASMSYALPEAARAHRRSGLQGLDKVVVLTSGILALVVVGYGVCILVAPDALGEILAGRNWNTAQALAVPTTLWVLGTAASQGPRVGLRVLGRGIQTLRVSLVMGGLLLAGTVGGVLLNGGVGAAWGFGLVSVAGQGVWWSSYARSRRRVVAGSAAT